MTLTLGGSPTPERRLVREMVVFWMALVNLFFRNVPSSRWSVSRTGFDAAGKGSPRRRSRACTSLSFGILVVRLRAVTGDAFGRCLHPDELLFLDRDSEYELPVQVDFRASEPAFVEHVFRVEIGIVMIEHEPGAVGAANLLIGNGHQDDVAVERHFLAGESQERVQLKSARPLHVHGAPAPDIAVFHLTGEGVDVPAARIRGHDIHVVEQENGLRARARARALQPRYDDDLSRGRIVAGHGEPLALENALEKRRRFRDVSRRIGGVEADVLPQRIDRFGRRLFPVDVFRESGRGEGE